MNDANVVCKRFQFMCVRVQCKCLLLLWRVLNDKMHVKVINNFLQCKSAGNDRNNDE